MLNSRRYCSWYSLVYATAMPFHGNLVGMVVENHEGRPTKIEGNDLHPASQGNTNAYHQATMLEMYDPDLLVRLEEKVEGQ